jgi:NTE family protein
MKEITLALGGGGVKGFAHIGVLRVLEQEGFTIRAIAGTSAGGLVGSVYAAGYSPDEIEKGLTAIDQSKLYGRTPGDGPAMMGLSGVTQLLHELLGDKTFADTRMPFAVTAVDADSAELLAIRRGRLVDAVLATIAVPGVFPPRAWEGRTLIDGGILDPAPVSLARYLAPGLPAAVVVLSPPIEEWKNPTAPRLLASLPFLSTYLARLRVAQAFNIFLRSIDIAGAELTALKLRSYQPEAVIRPPVPHIGFLDPVDVQTVVRLGEIGARAALPELNRVLSWQGRIRRSFRSFQRKRTVLDWEHSCEDEPARRVDA